MQFLKRLLLLFVISLVSCNNSAGNFYTKTNPFIPLDNAEILNDSIPWGAFNNTYDLAIGFPFTIFDKTFDSLHLETTGRIVFDDEHQYFADAFSEISMQDAGFNSHVSMSPIRYKNQISKDDNILIIEFENASFASDTLSRITFQIKLHEKSGDFELHMGPNTISDFSKAFQNGPHSGVSKVISYGPTVYEKRVLAYGNAKKPEIITEPKQENDPQLLTIENMPAEGSIYRFSTKN